MTLTIRWPLRFGCVAIVLVDGEPDDGPAIDPRQAHLVGCRCDRCVALLTAPPAGTAPVSPARSV